MSAKINKAEVLNRIKEYFGLKTNAKLATFLGIAPTTLSSWYSRETFDLDVIYSKCVDVNLDWLLTGRTSMVQNKILHPNDPPIEKETNNEAALYYKLYKEIDKELKDVLKENGRLEERLRLLETDTPDFSQNAGGVSTESTLSRTNQGATSAGVPLKD